MHGQLAATAQRDAADGRDHRHLRVADAQHCVLQLLLFRRNALAARLHEHRHQRLEVGAGGEHVVGRPDHERLVRTLGQLQRLQQALAHGRADEVQLRGDAGDDDLLVERPDPHLVVPEQLGARLERCRRAVACKALGKMLARIDRQRAARQVAVLRRAPRAF